MKKLLSLALLITTIYADSSVESTQSQTQPVDTSPSNPPVDVAPSQPAPMDQCPMEEPPVVEPVSCDDGYGSSILTEFKMGYFRFGDRLLRHTYDKGILDLQLTFSFRVWKPIYVYTGIEYVGANGVVPGTHSKRKIRSVPISLGLQYIQPITVDLKYYLTLGPRYFFVHQWNHSKSLTRNGLGGFANTGFIYYLSQHIVVDFFGEYSFKKMHFNHMGGNLQVGGMTLGAGIGYFW
ncbi:MAG TPA: hypothetical protein VMR37_05925 [Rhabdochlamydiaceae bacterium]|jgi:hypothetical protein|nr:hypothetical protein [Rhabdochlamydiaceae bacterium]